MMTFSSLLPRQLLFWLLLFAAIVFCVAAVKPILSPFVVGLAVAYLLHPVCLRAEKWGMSRTVATLFALILFILTAGALLLLLVPLFADQIGQLAITLPPYIDQLRLKFEPQLQRWLHSLPPDTFIKLRDAVGQQAGKLAQASVAIITNVAEGGAAIMNALSFLLITPLVAFYLLRDWPKLLATLDSWLPRLQAPRIREWCQEIDQTLAAFVRGQTTVCVLLGLFYGGALSLLGLQSGAIIGIITGILSFIPFVGVALGLILALILGAAQFGSVQALWPIVAIFMAGQVLEGNVITPKLVGEKVGLHPVAVIFALMAAGQLMGFVGMLLALPLAAVMGVMLRVGLASYKKSRYYHGHRSAQVIRKIRPL